MHSGRGSRRSRRPHGKTASLPSRQVLEGWLFVTKEGCSWLALPERFAHWHPVYMRGRRWIDVCVLERVFAELQRVELEAQLEQREPDRPRRISLDCKAGERPPTGAPGDWSLAQRPNDHAARRRADGPSAADPDPDAGPLGRCAPCGRWVLERHGPISGQPQLVADRAYRGDAMRALAAELGWEF